MTCWLACVGLWLLCSSAGRSDESVRIEAVTTNGFVHPGIGFTKEILDQARVHVANGREPWTAGFRRLAAHPQAARSITIRLEDPARPGQPKTDAFDSKSVENLLRYDGATAKRQALMYVFTGDAIHRANALRILRVWSRLAPRKYRNYREAHIHASYPIQDLIVAAELLRYSTPSTGEWAWSEQDTRDFTENVVAPAVDTFLNENGWFMNQNGYPLVAAMAGDIFRSDRASYAKRVEWFTVNASAPNKGWSSSLTHLARRVDTNALTGAPVERPQVQLMEMGRDQAHAHDDVEIFNNTARLLTAQGTRVDPRTGEVSTAATAVSIYAFLDDRILSVADYFCRFMLGYETPWIPAPYNLGPNGEVRGIYPRLADNYRGRIRGLDIWDIYYHYAVERGSDVAKLAPYYHEAYTKRIIASDTDWIFIPDGVEGELARVPPTEQQPAVVEIEERSTLFDDASAVVREGPTAFVRVRPSVHGSRLAVLSCDTEQKVIGLRFRTRGAVTLQLSGVAKPWRLPDTHGEWRRTAIALDTLERFIDIVYVTVWGAPSVEVDLDCLYRAASAELRPASFRLGSEDLHRVVFVGAPIRLDFGGTPEVNRVWTSAVDALPSEARIDGRSGEFRWVAERPGAYELLASVTDGDWTAAKRIQLMVAPDRSSALSQVLAGYDPTVPVVPGSAERVRFALQVLQAAEEGVDDAAFCERLMALQDALGALRLLTPLRPDGSIDYPPLIESSNIGASSALLADGNDDTFPVYTLAQGLAHGFDFGARYRLLPSRFAIEGRLNFEERTQNVAIFGSADGTTWTQLTAATAAPPVELTDLALLRGAEGVACRFLKIQKLDSASGSLFEPAELRIYGRRIIAAEATVSSK